MEGEGDGQSSRKKVVVRRYDDVRSLSLETPRYDEDQWMTYLSHFHENVASSARRLLEEQLNEDEGDSSLCSSPTCAERLAAGAAATVRGVSDSKRNSLRCSPQLHGSAEVEATHDRNGARRRTPLAAADATGGTEPNQLWLAADLKRWSELRPLSVNEATVYRSAHESCDQRITVQPKPDRQNGLQEQGSANIPSDGEEPEQLSSPVTRPPLFKSKQKAGMKKLLLAKKVPARSKNRLTRVVIMSEDDERHDLSSASSLSDQTSLTEVESEPDDNETATISSVVKRKKNQRVVKEVSAKKKVRKTTATRLKACLLLSDVKKRLSQADGAREEANASQAVCFVCGEVSPNFVSCPVCSCSIHDPLSGDSDCGRKLTVGDGDEVSCPKCAGKFAARTSVRQPEGGHSQACVVCDKTLGSDEYFRAYCSDECLVKLLDQLESYYHSSDSVTVKQIGHGGSVLHGERAPKLANLYLWLKTNPDYVPLMPPRCEPPGKSEGVTNDEDIGDKKMDGKTDKANGGRDGKRKYFESNGAATTPDWSVTVQARHTVKRNLSDVLMNRARAMNDVLLVSEEIKQLACKVENEVFNQCEGDGTIYRKKLKSLLYKLRNEKHSSFFRRVISGELTPSVLAQMGQERAKVVKSADAEQDDSNAKGLSPSSAVKQRNPPLPLTYHKEKEHAKFVSTKAEVSRTCDAYALPVHDTTAEHRSHLFDVNCRICTGVEKGPHHLTRRSSKVQKDDSSSPDDKSIGRASSDSRSSARDGPPDINRHRTDHLGSNGENRDPAVVRSRAATAFAPKKPNVNPVFDNAVLLPPPSPQIKHKDLFCGNIWYGTVTMPNYLSFETNVAPVSGPAGLLKGELPSTLTIIGRIPKPIVHNYISQVQQHVPNLLVIVRLVEPFVVEDRNRFHDLYNNMITKGRYCVVDSRHMPSVKDFYLIPLAADETPHPSLLPFRGPGLHDTGRDVILGIIISHHRSALATVANAISKPASSEDVVRTALPRSVASTDEKKDTKSVPFHLIPLEIDTTLTESCRRLSDGGVANSPYLQSPAGSSKSGTTSSGEVPGTDFMVNSAALPKHASAVTPGRHATDRSKPSGKAKRSKEKEKRKDKKDRQNSLDARSDASDVNYPGGMNEWMAFMSTMMMSMLQSTPPCFPAVTPASTRSAPAAFTQLPRLPVPATNLISPVPAVPAPPTFQVPRIPLPVSSLPPHPIISVSSAADAAAATLQVGPTSDAQNLLEEGEIKDEDDNLTAIPAAKQIKLDCAHSPPNSMAANAPKPVVFSSSIRADARPAVQIRPPVFDFSRPPPPLPRGRFPDPAMLQRFPPPLRILTPRPGFVMNAGYPLAPNFRQRF